MSILREPWPWFIAGPLIGLFVPLLLLIGNKALGMSGSLRALCAAIAPGNNEFLKYDWKRTGGWSIALAFGILLGAALAATLFGPIVPDISPASRDALATLGLDAAVTSLAPESLFSWRALFTLRGALCIIGGGFLVGFGASYGGGCTSGHGITGLANLQPPSVIALIGIFVGGLLATFVLIPLVI